jgi:hypothetical protein
MPQCEEAIFMKLALLTLEAMLICATTLKAQEVQPTANQQQQTKTTQKDHSKPADIGPLPATASTIQPMDNLPEDSSRGESPLSQEELQYLILQHWRQLPDNPKAKVGSQENTMCPAGVGNSCAVLGGWVYYPDLIGLSYHNKTWWDAMKNPGMLSATLILIGTTVLDIEGSQACIDKHVCRELNPLMRGPKAEKYAIAMSANTLFTWWAVRGKQHGRGAFAFGSMWALSVVHSYFGIQGLYLGRTGQIGPGKALAATQR